MTIRAYVSRFNLFSHNTRESAPSASGAVDTFYATPARRIASVPDLRAPHSAFQVANSEEAPEQRQSQSMFAATVQRVLGTPSSAFERVFSRGLQDHSQALMLLTDPHGAAGEAMLAEGQASGWVAYARAHGDTLNHGNSGWGLGALDGLLYRGRIMPAEYWTASTLIALWRDSQLPSLTADATLPAQLSF